MRKTQTRELAARSNHQQSAREPEAFGWWHQWWGLGCAGRGVVGDPTRTHFTETESGRLMRRWWCAVIRGGGVASLGVVALCASCGRVGYPEGDGDGSTSSSLECFDGELRLSETACDGGKYLVERCEGEEWHATEDCRVPEVPCDEGEVVETEEICGEYEESPFVGGIFDYNRVLEGCRGGVRQKLGCTCGAPEPTMGAWVERHGMRYQMPFEPESEGKDSGRILGIEGVTYPGTLTFIDQEVKTDLSHVLCIGWLAAIGHGFGDLSSVVAINLLSIAYNQEPVVVPLLPALRKLHRILILSGDNVDLSGLEGITELGELSIKTNAEVDLRGLRNVRELEVLGVGSEQPMGITSLEGLEGITRARRVWLDPARTSTFEVPRLLNYAGLKNLEYVEERFTARRSIEGLRGLENLRSVGDLSVDIVSEADIDVLGNLEEVRGDMELNLARHMGLTCSVPRLLDHVEVSGTITVDNKPWEDIDLSSCE